MSRVNLGSPTRATYGSSVCTVAHNLKRAAEIGVEDVVADSTGPAMRQVRKGMLAILETLGDSSREAAPRLLLEPTAGQGRSLCAGVDLEAYMQAVNFHPKARICLDTCHAFAAAEPLDEAGGATAAVDRTVEIGGPGRLRLAHGKDSMDVRGAFKDRHQKTEQGHIGLGAFQELFAHPETVGVPFVLQTPGSRDVNDPDLPLPKKIRASVVPGAEREPAQDSA